MTHFDVEETLFSLILTCCFFIGAIVGTYVYASYYDWPKDKIEQCEAELPLNQKCVLVAIPEEK